MVCQGPFGYLTGLVSYQCTTISPLEYDGALQNGKHQNPTSRLNECITIHHGMEYSTVGPNVNL